MATNKEKTYWPHMIVGFLTLALTLSFWTVKSASSLPVQESNTYLMKYQQADIHINEVLSSKAAFDALHDIELKNVEMMAMTDNIHSKRLQSDVVKLQQGQNKFSYKIASRNGEIIKDANVTFLLTQPHSRKQDKLVKNVSFVNDSYVVSDIDIQKAGRYTLQLRVEVIGSTGYSEIPAYLKP
jgi:hypothetical protein